MRAMWHCAAIAIYAEKKQKMNNGSVVKKWGIL
jgi:hypothetical protein